MLQWQDLVKNQEREAGPSPSMQPMELKNVENEGAGSSDKEECHYNKQWEQNYSILGWDTVKNKEVHFVKYDKIS